MHRAAWGLLALLGLGGIGVAVGLGPLIGAAAKTKAAQRGIRLEFGSVRPGWLSATFREVRVELEGVPGVSARLDQLDVQATRGLGLASAHAQGGSVSITTSLDAVRAQLRTRRTQRASGSPDSAGESPRLSAEGLTLHWQGSPGRSLQVEGLGLQQRGNTRSLSFARAELSFGLGSIVARGLQARAVSGAAGPQLAEVTVQEARGRLELVRERPAGEPPAEPDDTEPGDTEPGDTEPDGTDAVAAKPSDRGKEAASEESGQSGDTPGGATGDPSGKTASEGESPTVERPRISAATHVAAWPKVADQLWQWAREGIGGVRRVARRALSEEARVSIERVQLELAIFGETLKIGPAPLRVSREDQSVVVALAPQSEEGTESSSPVLTLDVPLSAGNTEFHLSGGPVSLATLGVQEGNLGLIEVHDTALRVATHATLSADGTVNLDAEGSLSPLNLQHPAVGSEPIRGMALSWGGKAWLDLPGHRLQVLYANLGMAPLELGLNLSIEEVEGAVKLDLKSHIPSTPCQALLDAAPTSLLPRLEGMALGGSFAMDSSIGLDSSAPDKADVAWNLSTECTVEATPTRVDPRRFKRPFQYWVTDKEGQDATRQTGPNTETWTAFGDISPNMETALVVCEDSRFFEHPGYDNKAIGDSIRANLRAGHFVRGASTLSMQLAKNLYLGREKTLSRKLQEAAFTLLLEDKLEKEQILELYLNVVEFGPDVYGIRQAAEHYFKSHPSELSLGQALFLASLLPSPSRERFEEDGKLSSAEARHIKRLMKVAHRIRRISEEELEAGLAEELVFGQPDPNNSQGGFLFDTLYRLGGG